jgi:hypothetical protein
VRDGAEAAAFDEDRLLIENLGGLEDFAASAEHHGVGEAVLNELKREQAVIDVGKRGAAELQHVHLDAARADAAIVE